jgi:hypothetical protein
MLFGTNIPARMAEVRIDLEERLELARSNAAGGPNASKRRPSLMTTGYLIGLPQEPPVPPP